jgi:hypothetical protein
MLHLSLPELVTYIHEYVFTYVSSLHVLQVKTSAEETLDGLRRYQAQEWHPSLHLSQRRTTSL